MHCCASFLSEYKLLRISAKAIIYMWIRLRFVWRIANTGKPYFLSRPRRFGKSLLLSTFETYFKGQKELFEGLAIEKMETEWKKFPVLHLDLNAKNMKLQLT